MTFKEMEDSQPNLKTKNRNVYNLFALFYRVVLGSSFKIKLHDQFYFIKHKRKETKNLINNNGSQSFKA